MLPTGRTFYKMSGSGNDFVMVDAMREPPGALAEAGVIPSTEKLWRDLRRKMCVRGSEFAAKPPRAVICLLRVRAPGGSA